jgi:uncharacterized protein (TIGR03118 family)
MTMTRLVPTRAILLAAALMTLAAPGIGQAADVRVAQANLVTDDQAALAALGFAAAANTDAHLIDPRGIAASATGPFWVVNHGSNVATLYNGAGAPQPLVVSLPGAGGAGIAFNGAAGAFNGDVFLFGRDDGGLAGWRGALGTTAEALTTPGGGPSYTGVAVAATGGFSYLLAADQASGAITVLKGDPGAPDLTGKFIDPVAPSGFSPFNVANLGGHIFVSYTRAGSEATEPLGTGFVSEFDLNGNFLQRLATGGNLASPWGMAIAPSSFGAFAGALLVANHSDADGFINAYRLSDGSFLGHLEDAMGAPLEIPDLWGLAVGNDGNGGASDKLYFTAGLGGGAHGLFGSLSAVSSTGGGVPEPQSWALMLVGFGLLGTLARRRPRRGLPAAKALG